MYTQTTKDIKVEVEPIYLEEESSPGNSRYFWAYHVSIENKGRENVRLCERYWKITNSHGHIQEVRGEGVVGEQPTLKPGQTFRYTSGAPLSTPWGMMFGEYTMETEEGKIFTVEIPAFSLDSPHHKVMIH